MFPETHSVRQELSGQVMQTIQLRVQATTYGGLHDYLANTYQPRALFRIVIKRSNMIPYS